MQPLPLAGGDSPDSTLRFPTVTPLRTHVSTGVGRRIFLSLFFAAFFAVGLTATGLAARSFWGGAKTHAWTPVECTVVESRILPPERKNDAELSVRYRYRYDNREYVSSRVSQGLSSGGDSATTYRLSQQLSPGTRTTCYVNPVSPEEAVLFRASLWSGLIVLFPLIFVAAGLGGIFFVWRRQPASSPFSEKSISSGKKTAGWGPQGVSLFFGVFLLIGLAGGYGFFVKPLLRIAEARSWTSVPCTIVSSRIASHSDSDGTSYSVEVIYRYAIDGRDYTAARYKFMTGSSSGYRGKAEIVAQLPAGKQRVCYVNPQDPTDAVLERGFTHDLWFGLIPLVFAVVGAAGLWFGVLRRKNPASEFSGASLRGGLPGGAGAASPSGKLRPAETRFAKVAGLTLFALIWNGIVSVFLVIIVSEWRHGQHPWFLSLFITPFVAVGLFAIGAAVRQALAFSNPRPRLTVRPPAASVGQPIEVSWATEGKVEVLRTLCITLEGREEATYRRGTDTVTDKNVFATFELLKTTEPSAIRAGTARLTLPAHTMHSWQSEHNRIIWSLRVRGEIPRWPDVDDEFAFSVLPLPPA